MRENMHGITRWATRASACGVMVVAGAAIAGPVVSYEIIAIDGQSTGDARVPTHSFDSGDYSRINTAGEVLFSSDSDDSWWVWTDTGACTGSATLLVYDEQPTSESDGSNFMDLCAPSEFAAERFFNNSGQFALRTGLFTVCPVQQGIGTYPIWRVDALNPIGNAMVDTCRAGVATDATNLAPSWCPGSGCDYLFGQNASVITNALLALNDSGDVVFTSPVSARDPNASPLGCEDCFPVVFCPETVGLWLSDGTTITEIDKGVNTQVEALVNDATDPQVVYRSQGLNMVCAGGNESIIWWEHSVGCSTVVSVGTTYTLPGMTSVTFADIDGPIAFNNNSRVLFVAETTGGDSGLWTADATFDAMGVPTWTLTKIAQEGDAISGGSTDTFGNFMLTSGAGMNGAGDIAFSVPVSGDAGIFLRKNGTGTNVLVLLEDDDLSAACPYPQGVDFRVSNLDQIKWGPINLTEGGDIALRGSVREVLRGNMGVEVGLGMLRDAIVTVDGSTPHEAVVIARASTPVTPCNSVCGSFADTNALAILNNAAALPVAQRGTAARRNGGALEVVFRAALGGGSLAIIRATITDGSCGAGDCSECDDCRADLNGDGSVDAADLSLIIGQFGASVEACTGADLNGTGRVDAADMSVLIDAFGTDCD